MKVEKIINKTIKIGKGESKIIDIDKYMCIEIYAENKRVGFIPSGMMFEKMYIEIKNDYMYLSINNNIVASYWYIDTIIIREA